MMKSDNSTAQNWDSKDFSNLEDWLKSKLPEDIGEFEISIERIEAIAAGPRISTRELSQAGTKAAITHRCEGRTRILELWMADSADWGAWNYAHEDADGNFRDPIPFEAERAASADEARRAVFRQLDWVFSRFLKNEVLLPAMESWLDRRGIAHAHFVVDILSGLEDEDEWAFLELIDSRLEGSANLPEGDKEIGHGGMNYRALGVTGNGRAGLFRFKSGPIDFRFVELLKCDIQTDGVHSSGALESWLTEHAKTITANA